MGRPYARELTRFPKTFDWAARADVEALSTVVRHASLLPMVAVGSGGALTAATFAAAWHRRLSGRPAQAVTPLEAAALGRMPRDSAITIFSAGGRNRDILEAFRAAVAAEPPILAVMTAASRSLLATAAMDARFPRLISCDVPGGRDGFLATNSLLAFCVLMQRVYGKLSGLTSELLPSSYAQFCGDSVAGFVRGSSPSVLWDAESIVVLHGYATKAAAIDFESKCTEAALAHVLVADYRNFAHGRHHWLAKRPNSAVLALYTPEDERLASETVRVLPKSIPVVHLSVKQAGMLGGLRLLIEAMKLIGEGGISRGIDPGRPGVPRFGARLYSLRVSWAPARSSVRSVERDSVSRKVGRPLFASANEALEDQWRRAFERARDAIQETEFQGVVLDYDGTLVDAPQRFIGPLDETMNALRRLLEAGVPVAVATGRGRSVGRDLRSRLPTSFHDAIFVGYYNGGDIALLADASRPDNRDVVSDTLEPVLARLRGSATLVGLARITPRVPQITIEPLNVSDLLIVWDLVQLVLSKFRDDGVRAVTSGHSIDVLAPHVNKLQLVGALRSSEGLSVRSPILRIGDRGRWPGNDADLLAGLDAISVNEVSADPEAAWNFAPRGLIGARATTAYLTAAELRGRRLRISDLEKAFIARRRGKA